jgi:SAM domain (Sterile alpha motif)
MEVAEWLRGLGLERYQTAFRDNEIDWEALPKLTTEDLKDLGVMLGSHRRKLLESIAALQSESSPHRPAAEKVAVHGRAPAANRDVL